jgi:cytoskeletal protein RodZ
MICSRNLKQKSKTNHSLNALQSELIGLDRCHAQKKQDSAMSRLFFILIAAGIAVAAGAVSAQSTQTDTSTQTQTSQPSPETTKGYANLGTLSSETCTLLGK